MSDETVYTMVARIELDERAQVDHCNGSLVYYTQTNYLSEICFSEIDGGVMTGPRCSIGKTRRHLDLIQKICLLKHLQLFLKM